MICERVQGTGNGKEEKEVCGSRTFDMRSKRCRVRVRAFVICGEQTGRIAMSRPTQLTEEKRKTAGMKGV